MARREWQARSECGGKGARYPEYCLQHGYPPALEARWRFPDKRELKELTMPKAALREVLKGALHAGKAVTGITQEGKVISRVKANIQ